MKGRPCSSRIVAPLKSAASEYTVELGGRNTARGAPAAEPDRADVPSVDHSTERLSTDP
jgi:hypothetical protein